MGGLPFRKVVPVAMMMLGALLNATFLPAEAGAHAVVIRGLRPTYDPTAEVTVSLQSLVEHRIEVNVAVEQFLNDHWIEVFASITDSKHPYGKTVRLTPIQSKSSLPVSFRPLQKHFGVNPLRQVPLPLSLRLRVELYDIHGGKIKDKLWSSAFQVCSP